MQSLITKDQTIKWLGHADISEIADIITELANATYTIEELREDITSYD